MTKINLQKNGFINVDKRNIFFFHLHILPLLNKKKSWLVLYFLFKKSSDNNSIEHTTFVFFLGNIFLLLVIPWKQTLGFTAKTNSTLFNVTNASIINFDFSKKSSVLSSTNYKTLCYQVYIKTSSASVTYLIVYTLSTVS